MTILFDKKLDNLPTANDIILDEIVKKITHHIEQNRVTKRGVDKKTIQTTIWSIGENVNKRIW